MPWSDVPGARGVRTRPASETMADPDYEVFTDAQGAMHARKKPGFLMKNLPYIIGAGMGYGALANAGVFGATAAGGGASGGGGAAASSVLPSSRLAMSPLYPGPFAGGSSAASTGVAAGTSAAVSQSRTFTSSVMDWLKQPQNLMGLAGAAPLAMQAFGGNDSGSSPNEEDLLAEIRTNLGLQRARFQAAQPAFETAQRMAVGMAPVKYRSGGS